MTEAVIRRIGGSTFAKLPPALVRSLGLHDGDVVNVEVQRRGATAEQLRSLIGIWKDMPKITRENRPWQDRDV